MYGHLISIYRNLNEFFLILIFSVVKSDGKINFLNKIGTYNTIFRNPEYLTKFGSQSILFWHYILDLLEY